jgi:type II secretory pathway predicted ATPase ExeA
MQIVELSSPVFADSALQLVYKATQGIPRLINNICTHALFDAERRNSEVIEDSHIGRIMADLEKQRGLTA